MTINEAIELLEENIKPPIQPYDMEIASAIKLAIEALIRVRDDRCTSYQPMWYPLPSEKESLK